LELWVPRVSNVKAFEPSLRNAFLTCDRTWDPAVGNTGSNEGARISGMRAPSPLSTTFSNRVMGLLVVRLYWCG
jgi:hypothetical protein